MPPSQFKSLKTKFLPVEAIKLSSQIVCWSTKSRKNPALVSGHYLLPLTPLNSLFLYKHFPEIECLFFHDFSLFRINPLFFFRPLLSHSVPLLAMNAVTKRVNSTAMFVQRAEHREAQNMNTSTPLAVLSRAWHWTSGCRDTKSDKAWCGGFEPRVTLDKWV